MDSLLDNLKKFSVIGGRRIAENGQAVNIADIARRFDSTIDPFDQIHTAEYSPLLDVKSTYGVSILRDRVETSGGGSVTWSGGEYMVSGDATLETAERGRYLPGLVGLAGLGVRLETAPVDAADSARWGYFDDDQGFGFGVDTGGMFTFTRRGGSDVIKRYRADWLKDSLDGNGPSGFSFDATDGAAYRFPFIYYGYGTFAFEVTIRSVSGEKDTLVEVDRHGFAGSISIPNPNLPVSVSTSGSCAIAVGARQYGVYGRYVPERRIVSDWRTGVSINATGWTPLVSFRLKEGDPAGGNGYRTAAVKIAGVNVLSSEDTLWTAFYNPTLTGADFRTPRGHTAAETVTDYDISATAMSGGESLIKGLITGGQGNRSGGGEATVPTLDIPAEGVVTLAARTVTGTATASGVLLDKQEW